ncbi:rhamnosyltransferase WsaF family glycosyltransferase [Stenotrophomonas maltophilia group sp. LNF259]
MSRLGNLLRRVAARLDASAPGAPTPNTHVAEITPCTPRHDPWEGRRLNLVLPSINKQHYFGGIHTAVLIYRELCRFFPASRIILVDSSPDEEALSRFSDHVLVPADQTSTAMRQIVPFSDRYQKTLPVAGEDIWVATAWWTAYAAQRMLQWQGNNGGVDRPMVYLIQDFEPGFYPWSSQYALALSTYRCDRDIGIFNTGLLADFFEQHDLRYAQRSVFEPVLHDGLRPALQQVRNAPAARNRRIVVYARPGTPRNAFELICEGLRLWGWKDARAAQWEVAAPGELQSDLDLGPFSLKALGKLNIDAYAELLSTSALGLSLMVSPHPSYPPLEMAAFGMGVVTNRYDNKRLDETTENIVSLESMTPEAICTALMAQVDACERRQMMPGSIACLEHPLLRAGSFDRIAEDVIDALRRAP